MLFRPPADQRLDGIRAMLDVWNDEVDRLRTAALASHKGEASSSVTVAAAEEAHDALIAMLDDIDRALEALPAGERGFAALLNLQMRTMALLESVGNSMDLLAEYAADARPAPVRIAHTPLLQAAE